MALADPLIDRITAFLGEIGIPAVAEPVADDSLLPGVTIRDGALVFDPSLPYPGDLLHEAGHIAVTDPELRPTLSEVPSDPAEEMAAIAWSYAAALAIGIDPAIVLHEHGYRGGGAYLIPALASDMPVGVPMLGLYGMSAPARDAERMRLPAFPKMARWLR